MRQQDYLMTFFQTDQFSPSYVKSVVQKFTTTFGVKDTSTFGRPFVKTEKLQIQVLGTMAIQPKQLENKTAADVSTINKF